MSMPDLLRAGSDFERGTGDSGQVGRSAGRQSVGDQSERSFVFYNIPGSFVDFCLPVGGGAAPHKDGDTEPSPLLTESGQGLP